MSSSLAPWLWSSLWLLGPRMTAAGGWRKARRVARTDAGQFFARAGCPVEKPRNPHAYLKGEARKARHPGCRFFWLLFFGQAKKSDPASGRRTEARGRRASWPQRDNRTSGPWMTSFAVVKRFLPTQG